MASVEGLLFYYHAMYMPNNKNLQRPQYVVFYQMKIKQPHAAMEYHHGTGQTKRHQFDPRDKIAPPLFEYGPYVRFDNGKCNDENKRFACDEFDGGKAKHISSQDVTIPKLGYYWFSYPGGCPNTPWPKSDCKDAGGLCLLVGTELRTPDGVSCTFNYEILGWIDIDEVFKAKKVNEDTFFAKKNDPVQNTARVQAVLDAYNKKLAEKLKPLPPDQRNPADQKRRTNLELMHALPEVNALRAENPKCYETAAECNEQPCKRILYSQICEPCKTINEPNCVAPPPKNGHPSTATQTNTKTMGMAPAGAPGFVHAT